MRPRTTRRNTEPRFPLPDEILLHILSFLSAYELSYLLIHAEAENSPISRLFNRLALDNSLWERHVNNLIISRRSDPLTESTYPLTRASHPLDIQTKNPLSPLMTYRRYYKQKYTYDNAMNQLAHDIKQQLQLRFSAQEDEASFNKGLFNAIAMIDARNVFIKLLNTYLAIQTDNNYQEIVTLLQPYLPSTLLYFTIYIFQTDKLYLNLYLTISINQDFNLLASFKVNYYANQLLSIDSVFSCYDIQIISTHNAEYAANILSHIKKHEAILDFLTHKNIILPSTGNYHLDWQIEPSLRYITNYSHLRYSQKLMDYLFQHFESIINADNTAIFAHCIQMLATQRNNLNLTPILTADKNTHIQTALYQGAISLVQQVNLEALLILINLIKRKYPEVLTDTLQFAIERNYHYIARELEQANATLAQKVLRSLLTAYLSKPVLNQDVLQHLISRLRTIPAQSLIPLLQRVIENGNIELLRLLLQRKVKINTPIASQSMLTYAIQHGGDDRLELSRYLIQQGINLHALTLDGKNALQIACEKQALETIKLIIEHKPQLMHITYHESPIQLAIKHFHPETILPILNYLLRQLSIWEIDLEHSKLTQALLMPPEPYRGQIKNAFALILTEKRNGQTSLFKHNQQSRKRARDDNDDSPSPEPGGLAYSSTSKRA